MTPTTRRFKTQFTFLLALYAVGAAGMTILILNPLLKSPVLVSALPLLPGFVMMLVMLSMWPRLDELERRIICGAAMFALVTSIVIGLVQELLHAHSALPLLGAAQLLTLATAFWAGGCLFGWRRFRD